MLAAMSEITRSRDVAAPPDEVAAFVCDLERWPEWFALHKGWLGDVPSDVRVGTRFKHAVRILGVPADVTWEVARLDLPGRIVLKGRGSKRTSTEVDFRIAPHGGGSRIELAAQVGGLVLKPVEGQLRGWLDVRVDRTLDRLEALLA
jgi:carbon monoxide dehydrogenase subunit G